jgi:hypothetical protein
MGITVRPADRYGYALSDDILINNDTLTSIPRNTGPSTAKIITVNLVMASWSQIRLTYEHRTTTAASGEQLTTRTYLNSTLIDTTSITNNAFVQVSLDITGWSWTQGDTITLTLQTNSTGGGWTGQLKNLRLYGLNTPFFNTQETV